MQDPQQLGRVGVEHRELGDVQVGSGARNHDRDDALARHVGRQPSGQSLGCSVELGIAQPDPSGLARVRRHVQSDGVRSGLHLLFEQGIQQRDARRGPFIRVHVEGGSGSLSVSMPHCVLPALKAQ